jgi:hypothetical protein
MNRVVLKGVLPSVAVVGTTMITMLNARYQTRLFNEEQHNTARQRKEY